MSVNITAVMVTGKPNREYLARMAVRSFQQQKYQAKSLLIVNDGVPLLTEPVDGIRELVVPPGNTLGALRNMALEAVDPATHLVVQWDDDDYSHPQRLRWQSNFKFAKPTATVLRYEIHCHMHTGEMKICRPTKQPNYGFPGTLMHPMPTKFRYPEFPKSEDTVFLRAWRDDHRLRVLVNDLQPQLYVRFFHGLNTWSEKHVMGFPASPMPISKETQAWVEGLRQEYLSASAAACSQQSAGA